MALGCACLWGWQGLGQSTVTYRSDCFFYEFLKCNQRDATFRNLYYYHCCTCFGHFSPIIRSLRKL